MRISIHFFSVLMVAGLISGCDKPVETVLETPVETNAAVDVTPETKIRRPPLTLDPVETKIFNTNVSEELVLELSPKFRLIAKRLKDEAVDLKSLFDQSFRYRGLNAFDLLAAVKEHPTDQNHPEAHIPWPISESYSTISANELWLPILKDFKFEDTQFGVARGTADPNADRFTMISLFEGRFADDQQRRFGAKGQATIIWEPNQEGEWRITDWQQDKFEIVFSPEPLFENVTEQIILDPETREILTRSLQELRILQRFGDTPIKTELKLAATLKPGYQFFDDWSSNSQFPAVSITDVDQDGWEDVFVVDRFGKSVLLKNEGGNSFKDISAESGLAVENHSSCSLFVDFDNDGDADVLVGRGFEPSKFFRNEGGKFLLDEENTQAIREIRFVTSGSVADVNRDGLLDVYLCTYGYSEADARKWLPFAVPYEEEAPTLAKFRQGHVFLDRAGLPNVLLMNRGGKFELVAMDETLKQYRCSFQSVWSDVDRDGDQDLYICNDFAPDAFLRNDTLQGSFEPQFTEFTSQVIPGGSMAFGMGASWGDYNSDGQLDLYVSNMYSKAGLRIVQQMGGDVDPRIPVAARGNFLYENQGGKFNQVAGLEDNAQHVSKVGWSFGGQFADLNNDRQLDLYVPSGYFTAPQEIDSQVDL